MEHTRGFSFCIIPLLVQPDFQAVDLLDPQGCLSGCKITFSREAFARPLEFSKN